MAGNKKGTISACMIVKNEEKFLGQCLESIKDLVDEIIIVDTGSTDSTPEIARRYTDKVYFHEWKNDFSEARNYSIQFATSEWILIIDADEKLEQEDIPLIRSIINHKEFDSIFVAVLSEIPDGGISKNYSQRIFRRGKGYYEGVVHNQLRCEGEALVTNIRIYHYGYNLSQEEMKKKYKRTEKLLMEQISKEPNNTFAKMNLVRIYKCQGLWGKAIELAESTIKSNPHIDKTDPTCYQMLMYDMAFCQSMIGDNKEAEKTCVELISKHPDNLDAHFLAGNINIQLNNYQKAIHHYMEYIKLMDEQRKNPKFTLLIVDSYGAYADAWNNMGYCYFKIGDYNRAEMSIQKAIAQNNKELQYYENLVRILIRQNKTNKIIAVLEQAIKLGIATDRTYSQLSDMYRIQGDVDSAIINLRKALELNDKNISYYVDLSELLMSNGNLNEAEDLLKSAIALDPKNFRALYNMAKIYIKTDRDKAMRYLDELLDIKELDSKELMNMGNYWAMSREFEVAIRFYERSIQMDPTNVPALINMSTCYAQLGKYESALIGFRTALSIRPNDPDVINNLIAMKKAIESQII